MSAENREKITIFDTTLRDGEQSPGCSMNTAEKLEVARALVELGVDVIEAGFPIASPGDFEAVREIARQFGDRTVICGLARCLEEDVDRAWEALKDAERSRIHVFLATSAIHREFKLKMAKDEIVRQTVEMVKRAVDYCPNVEFSPEDASRTELDFLCEVVEKAIDSGATTVNIPDTVGYAVPAHYRHVFEYLKKHVPNIGKAVLSAHCHDDLGLGVANSLAAIEGGGRQRGTRGNRDGAENAGRLFRLRHGDPDHPAVPDQPSRLEYHRNEDPAKQGDRRPERVRPRGGHSSARHAAGADDLRDHAA